MRENRLRFRPRGVHAGQMRHRRQPVLALNAIDDGERLGARAAAGAVGDRTEIGRKAAQRRNGLFEQGPLAFVGPGREELDGNRRPCGAARIGQNVANETHQSGTRFSAGDCGTASVSGKHHVRGRANRAHLVAAALLERTETSHCPGNAVRSLEERLKSSGFVRDLATKGGLFRPVLNGCRVSALVDASLPANLLLAEWGQNALSSP